MEATIQSNQMDVDKEEARPNPEVPSLFKKDTFGGCQSFPHSPRSVPTDFDVNSEHELIHDNISRAEPSSSGSNRNIAMPIPKLFQSIQRRGVGNMPKPLAGSHELLLTHQELSWSGEDHRALRRVETPVLQR
ncbi:hypothetical protein O181_129772 [Austropuccinia psidii MF-1]|uniref:Uncharacterized protein n=1 Tax=Austropuccinia psidii MF-1 TaxID=1389203 RepID=A0A9Q3L2G6_9BASI|nr:hypothetical protein [Austropuccinia psidii MF-1]